MPLGNVKALGLDLSTLIVLAHLGLLRKTIDRFERIVIPAGSLAHLLIDRQRVRFHQPALIAEAEQLQALLANGTLSRISGAAQPDIDLTKDIGPELAELVATAARDGGVVIAPAPIHKIDSFMEVAADTSGYASLLSDTRAILNASQLAAGLDATTKSGATAYLTRQDRGWPTPAQLTPGRPIYLTSLATSLLSTAGLLPHMARLGAPIFVSRMADQHARTLIDQNRHLLTPLLKLIEDIRAAVAPAIASGRVARGPQPTLRDDPLDELRRHPTMALERALALMDVVAIDDRALNRHNHWTREQGNAAIPIVCSLDIIEHLHQTKSLSDVERSNAYFRLRSSGFSVVPVGQEELFDLVNQATATDHLVETAEMRAVRHSFARLIALKAIRLPQEHLAIRSFRAAAITGIRRLWAEASDPSPTKLKAQWLLDLLPDPHALASVSSADSAVELELEQRTVEIAVLAMPLVEAPQMVGPYQQWIEETFINPMQQSDPALVKRALPRLESLLANFARAAASHEQ